MASCCSSSQPSLCGAFGPALQGLRTELSARASETKQLLRFWGERRAPAMLEPRGIASKGAWHLRACSTSPVGTSQRELWYSSRDTSTVTRREINSSTLLQEGRAWAASGMGQETPNLDTAPSTIPPPALWVSQDIKIVEGKILLALQEGQEQWRWSGHWDTRGWVVAPVAVRITQTQAGHCSQSSL